MDSVALLKQHLHVNQSPFYHNNLAGFLRTLQVRLSDKSLYARKQFFSFKIASSYSLPYF